LVRPEPPPDHVFAIRASIRKNKANQPKCGPRVKLHSAEIAAHTAAITRRMSSAISYPHVDADDHRNKTEDHQTNKKPR
jgi:hypothetical protein